jgi:hypothetical protein
MVDSTLQATVNGDPFCLKENKCAKRILHCNDTFSFLPYAISELRFNRSSYIALNETENDPEL